MHKWLKRMVVIGLVSINTVYAADAVVVPIYLVESNKNIGTVKIEDSSCGVLITPNLQGLSPGVHGFHIHQYPSCANHGMAAGGHLDPGKTNEHNGPYNTTGHLGDLPVLIVAQDGTATLPTLAPKFTLAKVRKHSLMIHVGGDNYADKPEKLGGGGARMACGVIPE